MASRSILIKSLGVSLFIGLLWIGVAHSALVTLPFEWSGLAVAIWFLPILIAAEIQRHRPIPGLLLLSEALASLVASMGPFGWMSFQFGLAQGAVAEWFYRLRPKPGMAVLGALLADLALMAFHPRLSFGSAFGLSSWGLHVAGALLSIFIATTAIVGGAMAWRHATHACLILLFLPQTLGARPCDQILDRIAKVATGPFVIAVDFDGTAVDTDGFLVRKIIPTAVNRVIDMVPREERGRFRDYLSYLEGAGVAALPEFFEETHWHRATWPFPLAALPPALADRAGLAPGSSPLVGFWNLMAEIFENEDRSVIPVIPPFADFYRRANQRFGAQLHWVVVTARHDGMLQDIPAKMKSLGPSAHPVDLLGRGTVRAMDPKAVPGRKGEQVLAYRGPEGAMVQVFVENDARTLAHLRALDPSIVLLHMRRDSAGKSDLVEWGG